jgi:hypothetical protein
MAVAMSACGPEGLTLHVWSPMVVGSNDWIIVDRCLGHTLLGPGEIFPCSRYDTLSEIALTADKADAISFNAVSSQQWRVDAIAEGTTRLTVTAVGASGEKLSETVTLETRLPAHQTISPFESPMTILPGRLEGFYPGPITDSRGETLSGNVGYRVVGNTDFDGGAMSFHALGPGEIRVEPVPEELRAVATPLVFHVAAPEDVDSLHFARKLYGDAGLILPPPLITEVTPHARDGGIQGPPWFGREYPLVELRDGGWARPDLSKLHRADAGPDESLECTNEVCDIVLDQLGDNYFTLDVPPLSFSASISLKGN